MEALGVAEMGAEDRLVSQEDSKCPCERLTTLTLHQLVVVLYIRFRGNQDGGSN